MSKVLIMSVLAIPLFFHLGQTETLSERRLDEAHQDSLQLGSKNSRHGKHLILDNERRMTTKFDAKIRSKNYDANDDDGRIEERAKLQRRVESHQNGDNRRQRTDLRDARIGERRIVSGEVKRSKRMKVRTDEPRNSDLDVSNEARRINSKRNSVNRMEEREKNQDRPFRASERQNDKRSKLRTRNSPQRREDRDADNFKHENVIIKHEARRRTQRNLNEENANRDNMERRETRNILSRREEQVSDSRRRNFQNRDQVVLREDRTRYGSNKRLENIERADSVERRREIEKRQEVSRPDEQTRTERNERLMNIRQAKIRQVPKRQVVPENENFRGRNVENRGDAIQRQEPARRDGKERSEYAEQSNSENNVQERHEQRTDSDLRRRNIGEGNKRIRQDERTPTVRTEARSNFRLRQRKSAQRRQEERVIDGSRRSNVENRDQLIQRRETSWGERNEETEDVKQRERENSVQRRHVGRSNSDARRSSIEDRDEVNGRDERTRAESNERLNNIRQREQRVFQRREEELDNGSRITNVENRGDVIKRQKTTRNRINESLDANKRYEFEENVQRRHGARANSDSRRRSSNRRNEVRRTDVRTSNERNERRYDIQNDDDVRIQNAENRDEDRRINDEIRNERRERTDVRERLSSLADSKENVRRTLDRNARIGSGNVERRTTSMTKETKEEEHKKTLDLQRVSEIVRRQAEERLEELHKRNVGKQDVRGARTFRNEDNTEREDTELREAKDMTYIRKNVDRVSNAVRRNAISRATSNRKIITRHLLDSKRQRRNDNRREDFRDSQAERDSKLESKNLLKSGNLQQSKISRPYINRNIDARINLNAWQERDNKYARRNLERVSSTVRRNIIARTRSIEQLDVRTLENVEGPTGKDATSRQYRDSSRRDSLSRNENEIRQIELSVDSRRTVPSKREAPRTSIQRNKKDPSSRQELRSEERSYEIRQRTLEGKERVDIRNTHRNTNDNRVTHERVSRENHGKPERRQLSDHTSEDGNASREERIDKDHYQSRTMYGVSSRLDDTHQRRFAGSRLELQDGKEIRRSGARETMEDRQGTTDVTRNKVLPLDIKYRDDYSNELRRDETRTRRLLGHEEHLFASPKSVGSLTFVSVGSECFSRIRSIMKLGNSLLENMEPTVFPQVLLGGMTMALMWNTKEGKVGI